MIGRRGFLSKMVRGAAGLMVADDAEELLVEVARKLFRGHDFASEFVWQALPPGKDAFFAYGQMYFEVWGGGGSGGTAGPDSAGGGSGLYTSRPLIVEGGQRSTILFTVGGGGGEASQILAPPPPPRLFRAESALLPSPKGTP